jgi:radical SAM superfamily enzyme YgiQ (UPF0313 family)
MRVGGVRICLINYDNGSHLAQPPHHIAYLRAAATNAGATVSVIDMGLHHHSDKALALELTLHCPDVVGFGCIGGYWQYQQMLRVARVVNEHQHRSRLRFVLGGHMPAADPEWALRVTGADSVVVGDGEAAMQVLARGGTVDRIARFGRWPNYLRPEWWDARVYRLQRYPRVGTTQFAMPVLSARGCPFSCSFCFRMEPGHMPYPTESVMNEIGWLHEWYDVSYINFDDELLMSSDARIQELCEAILRLPFRIDWMCNGRLNRATPANLELMRRAGCVFVNYGVEALDDGVLEQMNKHLTVSQIHAGVQSTIKAGISPGLNVMWGNPGDTVETLQRLVAFLHIYDDGAQLRTIRPVTPYPGTALFARAVAEGRLRDTADFYERAHVNSDLPSVQWATTDDGSWMSNDEFCDHLHAANARLLLKRREAIEREHNQQLRRLYGEKDATFRGWRHT